MVLAFAAGNAGGITRDLLIGAVPPAATANLSYAGVSIMAGFAVFFWYPVIARLNNPVLWFDAVGLAFFAVAGTQKALVHGMHPVMAALLGMLTASLPAPVLLSIPIFGSRTQVLWHSGHLEGLVNFSSENSKPQERQRAGSTTALYSVCLRLRKRWVRSSGDTARRFVHEPRNLADRHRIAAQLFD